MFKTTTAINLAYIYDNNRKGAKYSLDGIHWMNGGEFAECMDKAVKGYTIQKDANTAYDMGSDIPETCTSVKSGKATLTSKVLGESKEEILNRYFETTHSTNWDWVIILDETVIIYNMNAEEFRLFAEEWSGYDNERKTVRFKTSSTKMIKWFEERL